MDSAPNELPAGVQWFYSPMAAPLWLGRFGEALVVYDCMDELANFRFAPADIGAREQFLLEKADVVFTGGYHLFETKSRHHTNTHFYGCGVDADHYSGARMAETALPAEVAQLPRPVLGYFGVIDERIDYDLLTRLGRAFSGGSVVMVGPFAKVDPLTLPSLPNLYWLGQRAYAELPALVKAFDVCLMPFALNEATQYINPTKTLEYMAAGKPIVSTAVPDVVRNFTPVVSVANSTEEFIEAAYRASANPDTGLIAEGIARAEISSWESTVAAMHGHILDAMEARQTAVTRTGEHSTPPSGASGIAINKRRIEFVKVDILVVGAGFSGAVMAERLADRGLKVLIIDKRPHIGGNTYDIYDPAGVLIHPYGPHIFHTNAPRVADYLSNFTAWRPYEHHVLAKVGAQFVPIPINIDTVNRLYGLDHTEKTIQGFYDQVREPRAEIRTSEDVVINAVGRDLYEKFFRGYTRKQWGLDPSQLAASVAARIPTRTNHDDRYFTDTFQKMPQHGYTRMFERMLDHAHIDVEVGVDFFGIRRKIRAANPLISSQTVRSAAAAAHIISERERSNATMF